MNLIFFILTFCFYGRLLTPLKQWRFLFRDSCTPVNEIIFIFFTQIAPKSIKPFLLRLLRRSFLSSRNDRGWVLLAMTEDFEWIC